MPPTTFPTTTPAPVNFAHARFVKGAHRLDQCPPDTGREVAVAGRSNAGKSSAINAITGSSALARAGKHPGRTRQINYFALAPAKFLVDLPGYGYAKAPMALRQHWQRTLPAYFQTRRALAGLVVVMDARHPLKEPDRQLIEWAGGGVPIHCLLTKADKLKNGPAAAALHEVEAYLEGLTPGGGTAQLFSAPKKRGITQAQTRIMAWLEADSAPAADRKAP